MSSRAARSLCCCSAVPAPLHEWSEAKRCAPEAQGGEDDLDALLAQFQLSDKRQTAVQVVDEAPPPSPRVFATFTIVQRQVSAAKNREVLHQGSKHALRMGS